MVGSLRAGKTALVLAVLLPLVGCGKKGEENGSPPPTTPVKVSAVERRSFNDFFNLIGTARADREATLVFEVGGVVEEIFADQGAMVRGGERIARLNDDLLRASLNEAKAARDLAVELHERSAALEQEGGISDFELSSLEREREMGEARYGSVKAQHDRTVLRAPFTGIVDTRYLDVGDYASPMSHFVRFLDLRSMRVLVPLPEIYLAKVEPGGQAVVSADPYPDRAFEGKVTFVSREVDRVTRTVTVEVRVPNEEALLRPGMTLRVRLVKDVYEGAIVVPQDAVVETEDGPAVFLAAEGAAARRMVKIGTVYAGMAVIDSGIAEGDSLIVVGNRELVEGERVEVLP
ncbi:MAG: efflux RND transporter periplasmic adaptor subunit [Candidatus Eisenbacteria bacterium]